jgi:hypothetical protein
VTGPVLVCDNTAEPSQAEAMAVSSAAPEPIQPPAQPSPQPPPVEVKRDPFDRSPAPGTPGYERRQILTKIRLEIERLCGDYLSQGAILHSSMIEGWLNAGADPDEHIYPAVQRIVAGIAARDGTIHGIGLFNGAVTDLLKESKRLAAVAADSASSAPAHTSTGRSGHRGASYAKGSGRGRGYGKQEPKSVSPELRMVKGTMQQARENGWTEIHDQMLALFVQATKGDQESLRKLKDLDDTNRGMVCHPRHVWEAEHSSAA